MIVSKLPARVSRIISEQQLFAPGDTIIVALSGGADSCALLDILHQLSATTATKLVAAHLNHRLRGTESDADERFCRELAQRYALPFECRRLDVAECARQQGLNLEDAGRRARITFLNEVRVTWQATVIALAHHADDQAETVLMRLLRGSGSNGLSGMSFRSSHNRIRPLLTSTRSEIEAYLRSRKLEYREDSSNRDTAFLRNRIRHELLPILAQYNPAIRERLVTTAALLADENELLEYQARTLSVQACSVTDDGIVCSLSYLSETPAALRRRIFRQALTALTGDGEHIAQCHILALEQLAESSRPNARLNLPRGITALREYGKLRFQKSPPKTADLPEEFEISGLGHYDLFDGCNLTICMAGDPLPPFSAHSNSVLLDCDKAPFPWRVRTFRPGDRIQPLGMTGSKKLKDLFIDTKIPLNERKRIPLVFSEETLIWACGLRLSRTATVDDRSKNIVMAVYSRE